jgi:hypothetical protein
MWLPGTSNWAIIAQHKAAWGAGTSPPCPTGDFVFQFITKGILQKPPNNKKSKREILFSDE